MLDKINIFLLVSALLDSVDIFTKFLYYHFQCGINFFIILLCLKMSIKMLCFVKILENVIQDDTRVVFKSVKNIKYTYSTLFLICNLN